MGDERSGKGRPASLMRGAEALAGLAVEIFVEEERVSPRRIGAEAAVCSVRWAPAVRVEEKQTQEAPLELRGDLMEIRLLA